MLPYICKQFKKWFSLLSYFSLLLQLKIVLLNLISEQCYWTLNLKEITFSYFMEGKTNLVVACEL